jgi:hypothetical protein
MKPSPNEQLDSLWGQNVGDDLGYLYYREQQVPIVLSGAYDIYGLKKTPWHNAIKFFGSSGDAVAGNLTVTFSAFGGHGASLLASTYNVPAAQTTDFAPNIYIMDISTLSTGSYYNVVYSSSQDTLFGAYLIHGPSASY